ncbi:hypothetical protein INS49_011289 [Diaporthe citri]|uniref:uncharacterized protein n=1 Tax=Diaporthe citri TaxID=83186 RepID=UPI001C7F119A|nr:uncharacterized protein INS49_011289 [Diaporthe citri]KAG6360233.1 hypothetical protein INS49_011289 [Diaporthe citri]
MEQLPSYQDATGKKQWLELVAPYIDPSDYQSLCCVSRQFHSLFAPRAWKDPLAVVRTLSRDTAYDYQWYSKFLSRIQDIDASTAAMVAVMDFRGFAPVPGPDDHQEAYNNSFGELATRLPNLRCLLLDGHPQLNLSMLSRQALRSSTTVSLDKIHLVSIANCGTSLPARFFGGQWLIGLVYLDMSNTPGTLGNQGALIPHDLPNLRILKLSGKHLNDSTAGAIVHAFGTQLWSLDMSRNGLTDDFLSMLLEYSLPTYSNARLQSNDHFKVEGQIRPVYENGDPRPNRGPYFIDESECSATFSSADRYLADPPVYGAMNGGSTGERGQATVHHSLITNTPTLESRSTGELTNLWLAETYMRERLDLAYPQTYVPDMNPRLYSLTVSMIPRYSTGIVAQRLTNFLRLVALQEQAIEATRALLPFRGPPVLQGLRHVRLEFEPDARDELGSLDNETDEMDSEALLEQGAEAFSFFSESAWGPSSSPVKSRVKDQAAGAAGAEVADAKDTERSISEEKIDDYPFNKARDEHFSFTINPGGNYGQPPKLVPVWVGSGIISPENPPAVNEYMRNVCDAANRVGICPATPCHVAAGVPAGSFIFGRAWDSIMLPAATAEFRLPTKAELRGMEDVVVRVKAFRLESRRQYAALDAGRRDVGGHEYWRGRLELVLPQGRVHSSDYWR